jgi:hypothetical protein
MASPQTFCTAPGCEEPSRQGRSYCGLHEKRLQRCQCPPSRCQCLTAPKQERLSPQERLEEAAHRYAESDSEDDAEYTRNRRDLLRAARQAGGAIHGELVRMGHAEARQRGVHIGRPPEVDAEKARQMVERLGSVTRAAEALGTSRPAIYRALARVTKDGVSLQAGRAA